MCGIFAYFGNKPSDQYLFSFYLIKHRGPDTSTYFKIPDAPITFGFHRLSINDLTEHGNQPLHHNGIYLICNGEIYNHKELATIYNLKTKTHSDCEVIIHLYQQLGIDETVKVLDGPFAFVLYDSNKSVFFAARDPIGIRPLFIGTTDNDDLFFASEAKALENCTKSVRQFRPGHYWFSGSYVPFWTLPDPCFTLILTINPLKQINTFLTQAVNKRINNSERPVGLLLSGGFDSSIVAALAHKLNPDRRYHSFSIGFHDSLDLNYARMVATALNTKHHEVIYTLHEALAVVPEVIYFLETFDVTTVRAGVLMWLLLRYIKKKTDIKVVLSGEGSDEFGSYLYFKDAPNKEEFQKESLSLLNNLHYFDVLRADRCTAAHGIEVRVPFLDLNFCKFFAHIDPQYKMPHNGIEKYHLRRAFDQTYLPPEVLWRKKDAFSDSVGHSWRNTLIQHTDTLYTDDDLKRAQERYTHLPPQTKEALWYRELFEEAFPSNMANLVPKYWMPKWQPETLVDPSATLLKN